MDKILIFLEECLTHMQELSEKELGHTDAFNNAVDNYTITVLSLVPAQYSQAIKILKKFEDKILGFNLNPKIEELEDLIFVY